MDHGLIKLSIINHITYQHDTSIAKTSNTILNINYRDHTTKAARDEQPAIIRQTIQSETTMCPPSVSHSGATQHPRHAPQYDQNKRCNTPKSHKITSI